MRRSSTGFTLVEILVALAVMGVALVSVVGFYDVNKRAVRSQDLSLEMEANLRLAASDLTFRLRNAGYGVPASNLSTWVSWVGAFATNPKITVGAGPTIPDTVSVAACTAKPIATVTVSAASGATTLTLSSVAGLNTTNKALIFIGDAENALVRVVSGSTITIDTNPLSAGNQGLSRAYPSGTPLCRVDVASYSVDTVAQTVQRDDNQGAGAQPIVGNVVNLKIVPIVGGVLPKYQVTFTATTSATDPLANAFVQRSMMATATKHN